MAIQLPPPPPLGPNGFASAEWQQWFTLLQQALTQTSVAMQGKPASFSALTATAGLTVSAGGAAITGLLSVAGSETVTGDLTVTGKAGFNTKAAQAAAASGGAVVVTAATNAAPFGYVTAAQADALVTLVNNIRAALVANGIMS